MNPLTNGRKYFGWFWLMSAVTAALRLLVVGRIGLSGDEAHYWTYSRYLDFSYFDHPPAIGYIIKAFTIIFGNTEFAVRLPAVLLFFFTSWFVFLLARELFDERTAFWSAALLNVIPVFSFLGAVMTVPDAPLAFFWMAFTYLFYRMVQQDKAHYWYALGALLGLGMLSKYNAVLLVPSALLFLLCAKEQRKWFFRKEPYLALLVAFIVFLPVIIWNMENNFASFGFQLQHGFGKRTPEFSLALLGRCLGAQAGYMSPLLFVLFWGVLILLFKYSIKNSDRKALFILSFSFPTLFLFNGIASFNEILPHWPATGYLVLTIAVAAFTLAWWDRMWFRIFSYCAWTLGILLSVLVPLQAIYKLLPPEALLPKEEAVKIEDGISKAEKVDITNELYGWPDVGRQIATIIASSPEPPFVFTHRHYIASQLSFYIPGHPRVYCLSDRIDAYDFWQRDLSALDGRDGIFVTNDYFYLDPRNVFPFVSWEDTQVLEIARADRKVRIFWLTRGKAFDLRALPAAYTAQAVGPRRTFMEALRQLDYKAFFFINRRMHFRPLDRLMDMLTTVDVALGVNTGLVFMVGVIGVILFFTRRDRFWKEFLLAVGIVVFGGILVAVIKGLVGRVRPLSLFGSQVHVFKEILYNGSFPSGHSQIAFSVATYLTSRFKKYWWLFYFFAVLVALSRVYIGVHFPLDILAGAVIGTVTTALILHFVKI